MQEDEAINYDEWRARQGYYQVIGQPPKREVPQVQPQQDIYKAGYQMGAALRLIITEGQPTLQPPNNAARFIGLKFAEWEGFRETRQGLAYLSGFTDGLAGTNETDTPLLPPGS